VSNDFPERNLTKRYDVKMAGLKEKLPGAAGVASLVRGGDLLR